MRLADSLRGVADHSADCLDRTAVFRLEASLVLRIVRTYLPDSPRLSSGQSTPTPADSPRQLGGQSDLYAETCQVCLIPLLLFQCFRVCFKESFLGLVVDP
jgi:hypothetical protein